MGSNLAVKKNISSLQVLKTLLVLMENNYTMNELVEKLNSTEPRPVFNNSVVSKYINTCRYLGIKIPKIHNKYFVSSLPFGLNLTDRDLDLIEYMKNIGEKYLSVLFNKRLTQFFNKLSRYSNKNITRVEVSMEDEVREKFENAIKNQRQIRLMYRTKEMVEGTPVDIVNERGKIYFIFKQSGVEKKAALERISGLEILDKKFAKNDNETVVFKLSGGLAKRYTKRDNEEILDQKEDYIVVSNKGETREVLFSRLLRYDSLCEILEPAVCREDMKKIINEMLSNYGD